jgi:hypothetical protein
MKAVHDGMSIGFMAGILVIVLLPILMATGAVQKILPFAFSNPTSKNNFSRNAPYTPPQSTRESIPNGTYAGWTQYHHNVLGFSVNTPPDLKIDELPQTRAEKPRYPEFMLQLSYTQNGIAMEFARVTVYDSAFSVNMTAQEQLTTAPFTSKPTTQTGNLHGHKSMQYFYEAETRTVVYLIDAGNKTYEIRGAIDTTDPTAVANYWNTFNNLLASFAID